MPQGALVVGDMIGVDIKVQKEDLVSIASSQLETTLLLELRDHREEFAKAQQAILDLQKKYNAELQSIARKLVGDKVKQANALLRELLSLGENEKVVTYQACLGYEGRQNHGDKPTHVVVSIVCAHHAFTKSENVPFTKELLRIKKESEATFERANELQKLIQDRTERLSNLPIIERQYRAKIAAERLNQSEEGQQMVASLVSRLQEDMGMLPGVPGVAPPAIRGPVAAPSPAVAKTAKKGRKKGK